MNDRPEKRGMSLIVKTVAHLLCAFILLFGICIVMYGHLTPGGGFAGGVIIACAFVLLTLAEGHAVAKRTVNHAAASALDCAGALLFLVVGLAGLYASAEHVFFRNFIPTARAAWFHLWSSGIILICNLGIGLKVGMSLLLVFSVLARGHVARRDVARQQLGREEGP